MAAISAGLAGSAELVKFLDLIAFSEGADYNTIVDGIGSIGETFSDFSDHPFAKGRPAKKWGPLPQDASTASGRYQLLLRYWRAYQPMLKLSDFSPVSQDRVALRQIRERSAISLIESGNIKDAITACSNIWISFPGNDAHQPGGKTMEELLAKYASME